MTLLSLTAEQTSVLFNRLGTALLLLSFLAGAAAIALALASRRGGGQPSTLALARRMVYVTTAAALAASLVLLHLLIVHDFSNEYVVGYTDNKMSLLYLITALWGGQKGSLLFWALNLLGFGALALHRHRMRRWAGEPWVIVSLMTIFLFFGVCLMFAANPFERFLVLGFLPDGDGLNPLLQNPAMVYHPPTILAGYAIWAVPFAYSIAALIVGDLDSGWQRSLRSWTVGGWLLLSLGNLFGAFWAYTELGWGGFWGWDPVENASLMPWFTASAYLHSVMIQERRGMAKAWNFSLLFVTFFLTLLGTFITRTGIVASVHAFGSGTLLGILFAGFMAVVLIVWGTLMVRRSRELLRSPAQIGWISQENVFLLFNVVMLAATAIVLWGTLFPTAYQFFTGNKVTIGPEWFNRYVTPLGVVIIALVGICPMIPWRSAGLRQLVRTTWLSLTVTAALTLAEHFVLQQVAFWYPGGGDGSVTLSLLALLATFFANLALVTIALEMVRGALVRRRRSGGNLAVALGTVLLRERRRYGGFINHAAVALMIVGFAGLAYKIEREEVPLRQGQQVTVGAYELTFDRLEQREEGNMTVTAAVVTVRRNGAVLGIIHPAQHLYAQQRRQVTTEVDTYSTLLEDLYVALVGVDDSGRTAVFKVVVNPMVIWLWVGSVLVVLGTALALLPRRWERSLVAAEERSAAASSAQA